MLKESVCDKRKERHAVTQEDFTPRKVCKAMFRNAKELFTDFSKTMLDPCCGIGNLLLYVLEYRLEYCKTSEDIYKAISTLYGTELMEDNVEECKENIVHLLKSSDIEFDEAKVIDILNYNIVCTDSNMWDYEEWKPKQKQTTQELY